MTFLIKLLQWLTVTYIICASSVAILFIVLISLPFVFLEMLMDFIENKSR